ncbi:MAG: hypothetical protein D6788_00645, partial [Planctomycetota bacterium]
PWTGCLGPRRDHYVTERSVSLAKDSPDADRLWEAALATLRRLHYRLDRVDRGRGIITTLPETSQHFFEVWRHDVDTAPDFWEATLNPIRRTIRVVLEEKGEGAWGTLRVEVTKQRLIGPDRPLNSTGSVYLLFGTDFASSKGRTRRSAEQETWIDAGRDPAMEAYVLRRILERAGMPLPENTPAVSAGARSSSPVAR